MEDYSAMKSCMEKNNMYSLISYQNSEKHMKAEVSLFPPDKPAEGISIGLENLGSNVR
jgi:hypothetical protein